MIRNVNNNISNGIDYSIPVTDCANLMNTSDRFCYQECSVVMSQISIADVSFYFSDHFDIYYFRLYLSITYPQEYKYQ